MPDTPTIADPLLMTAAEVGEQLRKSERQVYRDDATGRIPRPVRVGRAVRWRRDELIVWIGAGCPDRETWDSMRDAYLPRPAMSLPA